MKFFIQTFATVILLFSSLTLSYASDSQVEWVHPRNYASTLLNEIDRSSHAIVAALYLFTINPQDPNSPTYKIAQALINAKNRGAQVKILLDHNIDFMNSVSKSTYAIAGKNWDAYELLSNAGIEIAFDSPSIYTHTKVAIFDEQTVLLGSSNWSSTSFQENNEANLLLRSPPLAQQILQYLNTLEWQIPPKKGESTPIPVNFLFNKDLLGRMVTTEDHTGFDLYLYLLYKSQANASPDFELNLEECTQSLGLQKMDPVDSKRKITKVLNRLQKDYALLTFERNYKGNPTIHLNIMDSDTLKIPNLYWQLGWNQKLPLPGKVFYLLSLYYSSLSHNKPLWSKSGKYLAQTHHVSRWFIQQGVVALRRANLLEVQYSPLQKVVKNRKPNIYFLKPFYDPKGQESALKDLEERYGKEKYNRALKCAQLVYEDNDYEGIKRFIELEEELGQEVIHAAYKKIAMRNPDNPKRSIAYFFKTIQSIAEDN